MAVFTSNQVNHVYVAKAVKDSVAAISAVGDIAVGKTADGELYFAYKNAEGGIIRSDLIPIKNVMWANVIKGTDASQKRKLKKYTITLPTVEKDITYSVAIEINLHNGVESIYRKTASVVARENSETPAVITARLFETLKNSIERDDYVNDKIKVINNTTYISVVELPQASKYKAGLFANESVDFKVFSDDAFINYHDSAAHPLEVLDASINDITGSGSTNTAYTISNSYDIADLEYFALGERADLYRNIGWPNSFPSKTLAEAGDAISYGALRIHFAFTDSNEGVQKSEKDITIVFKENASTPAVAGTPLAANAAGTEGISYYTRANSSAGAGYLNDGSKAYTIAASVPGTHEADTYYPLTDIGGVGSDMNKLLNKIKVAIDGGYSGKELLGNSTTKLNITDYFN